MRLTKDEEYKKHKKIKDTIYRLSPKELYAWKEHLPKNISKTFLKQHPYILVRCAQLDDKKLFNTWIEWGCNIYGEGFYNHNNIAHMFNSNVHELIKTNPNFLSWYLDINKDDFLNLVLSIYDRNLYQQIPWKSLFQKINDNDELFEDLNTYYLLTNQNHQCLKENIVKNKGNIHYSKKLLRLCKYASFRNNYHDTNRLPLFLDDITLSYKINNLPTGIIKSFNPEIFLNFGYLFSVSLLAEHVSINNNIPVKDIEKTKTIMNWTQYFRTVGYDIKENKVDDDKIIEAWDNVKQFCINDTYIDKQNKNNLLHVTVSQIISITWPEKSLKHIARHVIKSKPALYHHKNKSGVTFEEFNGNESIKAVIKAEYNSIKLLKALSTQTHKKTKENIKNINKNATTKKRRRRM